MDDTKTTGLDAVTSLDDTDLLYVVTDVATTPLSKKITVADIKAEIGALLVTGTVTGATSQAQTFTNGVNLSNLTSGRVPYATTNGLLTDSSVLTFASETGTLYSTYFVGDGSGLENIGNAATVTNATFTTALTVNTGTLTLTANVANNSVLTIGAGAVSVSGSNTGDQTNIQAISDTKANFNTALSDGTFLFVGDAPTAHTASHAVGGADTIFPEDPGEDRYLMWDDSESVLVWSSNVSGISEELSIAYSIAL